MACHQAVVESATYLRPLAGGWGLPASVLRLGESLVQSRVLSRA